MQEYNSKKLNKIEAASAEFNLVIVTGFVLISALVSVL